MNKNYIIWGVLWIIIFILFVHNITLARTVEAKSKIIGSYWESIESKDKKIKELSEPKEFLESLIAVRTLKKEKISSYEEIIIDTREEVFNIEKQIRCQRNYILWIEKWSCEDSNIYKNYPEKK
jgi:peptidoglycan hydrolase CwlO-like protein